VKPSNCECWGPKIVQEIGASNLNGCEAKTILWIKLTLWFFSFCHKMELQRITFFELEITEIKMNIGCLNLQPYWNQNKLKHTIVSLYIW